MKSAKKIFKLFIVLMPWKLKRIFLIYIYGYDLSRTARIGFSWIYPQHLIMAPNAKIGHLNVAVNLDKLVMGESSIISRSNWITGYSISKKQHFSHKKDRVSELEIGKHSAITKGHLIDCTDKVLIGKFVTIAGYDSQLLTHSINTKDNIQDCRPIRIDDYSFIGTNVVILGGTSIPQCSILAAKSLASKKFIQPWTIYGGVPAKELKKIEKDSKYFSRELGAVA